MLYKVRGADGMEQNKDQSWKKKHVRGWKTHVGEEEVHFPVGQQP